MAEFAALDSSVSVNATDVAELERQWAEIESGAVSTVPPGTVARWLETWGTPSFKPWHRQ